MALTFGFLYVVGEAKRLTLNMTGPWGSWATGLKSTWITLTKMPGGADQWHVRRIKADGPLGASYRQTPSARRPCLGSPGRRRV